MWLFCYTYEEFSLKINIVCIIFQKETCSEFRKRRINEGLFPVAFAALLGQPSWLHTCVALDPSLIVQGDFLTVPP